MASYFSPNFCLFVIFFLSSFFNYYKISKYFFTIIIFNFFLSLPAIYYVFFLKIFFFLNSVSAAGGNLHIALNPANKIILISSIIFFHYIPFFFVTKNKYIIQKRSLIILGLVFITCVQFFNYRINFSGGGIIYKLSNILFNNNYILYFFSFLGFLLIFNLCYKKSNNLLLIFLIILGNLQFEIYHKYYDPMLLITFFTLFNINLNKILLRKKVLFFYIFNFLFLIANLMR